MRDSPSCGATFNERRRAGWSSKRKEGHRGARGDEARRISFRAEGRWSADGGACGAAEGRSRAAGRAARAERRCEVAEGLTGQVGCKGDTG